MDDFYLTHELKMGDYNRIFLVYPNGQFDVISSKKDFDHFRYFMYYVMKKESAIPELLPLYQEAVRDPFSYVQTFLNYYQVVVILDTTFFDEDPISYNAQVYLPHIITTNQYEILKQQYSYFNQYELWVHGGNKDIAMELLEDMSKCNVNATFRPGEYDSFLEMLQKQSKKEVSRR